MKEVQAKSNKPEQVIISLSLDGEGRFCSLKRISVSDEMVQGAISLERTEQGVKPWRIPYGEFDLFPPNGLTGHAETPAGVRIRFATDSERVLLHIAPDSKERLFDCVIDGSIHETRSLPPGEKNVLFEHLPGTSKTIEIYLPQTSSVTVSGLGIAESASFAIPPDARPRWVTYGSSISQCVDAASPAQTWPAIVAREQGYRLTCLGYRGNCHLEPMVARMIRDLPADCISLCLGINVYGSMSLSVRTLRAMVIGFIKIVREKHKETPLLVVSPIVSPPREKVKNAVGLTLEHIRSEIAAAVEALQRHGDGRLHYMNGLDWLGERDAGLLPDELHPSAEGYRLMGKVFGQRLQERNFFA